MCRRERPLSLKRTHPEVNGAMNLAGTPAPSTAPQTAAQVAHPADTASLGSAADTDMPDLGRTPATEQRIASHRFEVSASQGADDGFWASGSPAWQEAARTLFGEACFPWVPELRLASAVL